MAPRAPLASAFRAAVALFVGLGALSLAVPASAHPGHDHADAKVLIFTATTQFRHTDAINQGTPVLIEALAAEGVEAVQSENSGDFTDENLAQYDAIMMFQTSGDPWNADQKAALQRYVQAGGGITAVHNATDMRGNWDWWDGLIGTTMPGHAATGTDPGLPGTVRVEDRVHPSTDHLPQRWNRADEWYNYETNVRGEAHVLATMDETTYEPGGNAMGYDHPISWCRPYDGGRTWATGMGHFGSHFTQGTELVDHIVGGTLYTAGLEDGDCGGTSWNSFEKVSLDENTSAPFAMDVAPDGKVFFTELVRGEIRVYDPATQATSTAIQIPVYSGGEDGLLGITLANDFAETGHLYTYYSPASSDDTNPANFFNRLSRLTYDHLTGTISRDTEEVLLDVPARRLPDEPGHTGGGLDMDADGNLYLGVGDDVNPHSEPSGGYSPLSTRDGTFHDARETSSNTNDLRGKLLRIHPEADGSYTIPEGNLFDEADDADDKTLPEIYAMGFRNPFRFSVDQETGHISLADYSPDNNNDNLANRGPAGIAEWHQVKSPGNYGWPLCMGDNEPFRDVDFGRTSAGPVVVGDFFDCENPVNDSPRNTGLTELPPARAADLWYGYRRSSVPEVIPQGGGLAPMGGPVYSYDEALESDTKFPEYYDGKPFFYEWARNKMYSIDTVTGDADAPGSHVEKVNEFLPEEEFLAPIDSRFGPDGSLYVLDWGGGFGRDNPNSGLHRIDYIDGSRSPSAVLEADPTSGQAPLTVAFDGTGSSDPENGELTYAWDFTDDGAVDETTPTATHTYTETGEFTARLTVTDPDGKTGTTTVPIVVGNTAPEVDFDLPPNGSFFDFGDDLAWDVNVTDAEDTEITGDEVVIQPALGHDSHAHPTQPLSGFTGTTPTSLGGHAPDENIFFAIDARYTDKGGANGTAPLTGSDTTLVLPKLKQAEFFTAKSADMTVGAGRDIAGGGQVLSGSGGAWASYSPVNLYRVDQLALRVQSNQGGPIELRRGSADGELLATAQVPATPGRFTDVLVDAPDVTDTFDLVVVMPGEGVRRLNFIEAIGQGSSPDTRPVVRITAPAEDEVLTPGTEVEVTADATDTGADIQQVEFFAEGESLGIDTTAPWSATWTTPTEEDVYELTAVATNMDGGETTSRVSAAQVGELFGDYQQFSNAGGEYEKLGPNAFRITGAGNNAWQSVDQYSALYLPGGVTDDTWEAVVKVDAQTHASGSAKTGLIVRNAMDQPGQSAGYAMLGLRPSGGVEWLRDPDGNGQLNASEAGGTTAYPTWLKIARNGDSYTAYRSRNGQDWTQVGSPATLAGAADVQDVGMVTLAHSGTPGSADFSEFAVDDDPVAADPETTYAPLAGVTGPMSDDFATGLLGKWSVREATGRPVRTSGGSLLLPVTSGDINEANPGPISMVGQPMPSGDFEMSADVTLDHTSHWQYAGLVSHASDDEYTKLAFVRHQNGTRFLEFQTETGAQRTTHASFTLPTDFPDTVELKLTRAGNALTAHWSTDGTTWTALSGTAPVKPDSQIGLMAAGDTGETPVVASVGDFTVTPDREQAAFDREDEFDGDSLDGNRWGQTVRYDAGAVAVAGGELRITTQPGDINGNNPLQPRNFVLQAAPEGDWVASTRFKAPLQHRYQLAGLMMYADDDNYAKADVVAYNAPGGAVDLRGELAAEVGGQGAGSRNLNIPETSESGYWYLRVTKTGDSYAAEISDGGSYSWRPIGEPVTMAEPLRGLGLMAIGPEQEEPVTVGFDYFHLESDGGEEPGDTEAPTTTLTMEPAEPQGAEGWYTSAPTFSLGADDGEGSGVETTEYRIGEGEWTAYDGPVSVDTDGEYTVWFRSTDADGNVEDEKSATVKLDTVAPATAVEQAQTEEGAEVTIVATDDTSGVATTEYRVDGGDWQAYEAPFTLTGAGSYEVEARATDVAGLVGEVVSETVTVEPDAPVAPTVTVTGLLDGRTYGRAQRPDVRWNVEQGDLAVQRVVARLDGRIVQPGRMDMTRLDFGQHTLVVRVVDSSGTHTVEALTFTVGTSWSDTAQLTRRWEAQGAMTAAVRRDVVQGLNRARQLSNNGQPAGAHRVLRTVRNDLGAVRWANARSVLRDNVDYLIRQLG